MKIYYCSRCGQMQAAVGLNLAPIHCSLLMNEVELEEKPKTLKYALGYGDKYVQIS